MPVLDDEFTLCTGAITNSTICNNQSLGYMPLYKTATSTAQHST